MAAYRRFVNLLNKWPLDETKGNRDLGLHLRRLLKEHFPRGEGSKVPESEWATKLESLEKISQNTFLQRHPLPNNFHSATGLTAKECQAALSSEFLEALKEENSKGIVSRIFGRRGD